MKQFSLLILLLLGTLGLKAQDPNAIITKTIVIEASADDVWARLRQLDKLEELIPNYLETSWIQNDAKPGVGAVRACVAPGGKRSEPSYTETIVEYDDARRFYAYAVKGVPAQNMVNSFKVVDLGYNKCMVVWNSSGWTFVENPQMDREQFVAFLGTASQAMLDGLHRLHNGKS